MVTALSRDSVSSLLFLPLDTHFKVSFYIRQYACGHVTDKELIRELLDPSGTLESKRTRKYRHPSIDQWVSRKTSLRSRHWYMVLRPSYYSNGISRNSSDVSGSPESVPREVRNENVR